MSASDISIDHPARCSVENLIFTTVSVVRHGVFRLTMLLLDSIMIQGIQRKSLRETFFSIFLAKQAILKVYEFEKVLFDCPMMCPFEFSQNVFTEFSKFSDRNNIILKRLLYSNQLSPV